MEWAAMPAFLSPVFAPIALIWLPFWQVFVGVIALNILWIPIRESSLLNIEFSYIALKICNLKWITIPISIIVLWQNQRYGSMIASVLWPFLAGIFPSFHKNIAHYQQKLFNNLINS
jgi:hypothetical protein